MKLEKVKKLEMFDIVLVDFSDGKRAHEQSGIHPYVIIQNNVGNGFGETSIGISLTSKLKKTELPTHCLIKPTKANGLDEVSMIMGETVMSFDKSRILGKIGYIDDPKARYDAFNAYIANCTGRKRYKPAWYHIVKALFGIVENGGEGA